MKHPLGGVMLALLAIALLAPALATASEQGDGGVPTPSFVEESETAAIDQRYDGESPFFGGGGIAVFDCDADGLPDLYIAGGAGPAGLYRSGSALGGELRFDRVPDASTDLTEVTGAYPLDIDAAGRADRAVLRRAENVFLRGLGNCTFERANEAWGFEGEADRTTAFSAKWEADAPLLTMAFGDYLTIVEPGEQSVCDDSALYRPATNGDGYSAAVLLTPSYCTLSMLFSDWDRSGRSDLRMANDRHYYIDGEEQLWRVESGQAPQPWKHEAGWRKLRIGAWASPARTSAAATQRST